MSKTRVLIVEDHPLMGHALKAMLNEIEDVEVIAIARNVAEGFQMTCELNPDLVTLDYMLPDGQGTNLAKQIKKYNPEIKTILLSAIDIKPLYPIIIECGLRAIIPKSADSDMMAVVINAVLKGFITLPLDFFEDNKIESKSTLTTLDVEIMELIISGFTHEQVSEKVFVSKRTVDNYIKRIFEKCGVKNKAQAIERFSFMKRNDML